MLPSRTISRTTLLIIALLAGTWSSFGQWTTQTISLQPGWNAVFLEIQPEPSESDAVFAGLPVESVWRWNRRSIRWSLSGSECVGYRATGLAGVFSAEQSHHE